MFIQTEQTPNPATLKFIPECSILESGTASFQTAEDAKDISPFATKLFAVNGVAGVFFGKDFVTITKSDDIEWMDLKPLVLGEMIQFLSSGEKIITTDADIVTEEADVDPSDDEIVAQIKELINTRVRPAVAQDGGDIIFHEFTDGIVYVSMQGACDGCPASTATLKMGIENMLKYYIPEVIEVRAK
ncbi:MAG: NifU family protein [Alphaproteobacteria bacterium]